MGRCWAADAARRNFLWSSSAPALVPRHRAGCKGNTENSRLPQNIARGVEIGHRAATAASGVCLQVHETAVVGTQVLSW